MVTMIRNPFKKYKDGWIRELDNGNFEAEYQLNWIGNFPTKELAESEIDLQMMISLFADEDETVENTTN